MNDTTMTLQAQKPVVTLKEHIVEIISDSGEGAQRCGQSLGSIAASYKEAYDRLVAAGYKVIEVPMERECLALVNDARRGKNMFALGMLCSIYSLELALAREQIAIPFGKKEKSVIDANVKLLDAGHAWAEANLEFT